MTSMEAHILTFNSCVDYLQYPRSERTKKEKER